MDHLNKLSIDKRFQKQHETLSIILFLIYQQRRKFD